MEDSMKQLKEKLILWIVGLILVTVVVAIYQKLPDAETPKATFLIEVAKILLSGVVVGILGVWAKQALEGAVERKKQLEVRLTAKRDLFKSLHVATREAIRSFRDPVLRAGRFDYLFKVDDMDFEGLLDQWEVLEPAGPARQIRSTYQDLEAEFRTVGLGQQLRDKAEREVMKWSKQLSSRILGL
jgi:hypothetical protein